MILLQAAAAGPNVQDVTFRTTDVIMIIGGILALAGAFFIVKTQISLLQQALVTTNARISLVELSVATLKKEMEDENNRIHLRIDNTNTSMNVALEKNTQSINNLGLSMQQMELRMIEKIYNMMNGNNPNNGSKE